MTWFAIVFSTVTTALLAALLYAMPSITDRTLPLGVSVPQGRADDPIIASSVRTYRVGIVVSLVGSLIMTVALGALNPTAGMIAPVLVFTALGIGCYVVARNSITRAKREGGWYDDVPVRLTAEVSTSRRVSPIHFGWYVASVVLLVVIAGIGVGVYPDLPNPLPIHWDLNGVANGFAEKSVWSAFGVVLVGFGMVALLFATSFLLRTSRQRRVLSDTSDVAARRANIQQQLMGGLLGKITFVATIELSILAVIGWLAPSTVWLPIAATVVFLLLLAATSAIYLVRYRLSMTASFATRETHQTSTHQSSPPASADAPDDDRFWKAGLFYVNRNDPALMVPKRFGVGTTINLGHPAGMAIGVVILLVIAGSITFAILAPGSNH